MNSSSHKAKDEKKAWIAISDIHFRPSDRRKEDMVIDIIDHYEDSLDGIIFLGDIYDIWFGYKHAIFYQTIRFFARLKELRKRGVRIIYLEGNHDFFLKGFMSEYIGAEIYKRTILKLFGKNVYASHGDEFYTDSIFYRVVRYLMSCRPMQFFVSLMPVDLCYNVFYYISKFSREYSSDKPFDKERYFRNVLSLTEGRNIDLILTGHNHIEMDVLMKDNDREIRLLNPGGCERRLFYILITEEKALIKLHDIIGQE